MVGFRVDTKLFQELGELLVAKESTALVELIKNAYDADATRVRVHGESLDDPENGRIVVTDDGCGMTEDEFERGFLTIAGRTKITQDRRTPIFGRHFTGEKGVGRLAAHKLGKRLEVISHKSGATNRGARELAPAVSTLRAAIDWAAIEKLETLDKVAGSGAVKVETLRIAKGATSGTKLTISSLRARWGERIKANFLGEAVSITPDKVLCEKLPKAALAAPLLFDQIPIRGPNAVDPGFEISFTGELSLAESQLPNVLESANWVAEIDYSRETGVLRVAVAPTKSTLNKFPESSGFKFRQTLRDGAAPSFQARVFQKSNAIWPKSMQGVRVYMEGFRVPPYGDARDDWLDLDQTYKSRAARQLISLSSLDDIELPKGLANEELVVQGNAAYMGAVFLQRSSSEGLKTLVNREGFLPGPELDFIARWLRVATDLIVRMGYAGRFPKKQIRREERNRQKEYASRADVRETPSALKVRERAQAVASGLQKIDDALKNKNPAAAVLAVRTALRETQPPAADISGMADEFGREAVLWRILASLGTELAAFIHEINALGLEIGALTGDLDEASQSKTIADARKAIHRARRHASDLADRIRRNAAYLVDSTSFEGRRRRSRQSLAERFSAVEPFFERRLEQKKITIENAIPKDLRTPAMFPAELSGIFTNLLSNAVKFTEFGGRIHVSARQASDDMVVRMENTGTRVDPAHAAKFFEAYQSTTERPDSILGQGMGMGLTITRAFVREYGGEISFVPPSPKFATAIEFSIPSR